MSIHAISESFFVDNSSAEQLISEITEFLDDNSPHIEEWVALRSDVSARIFSGIGVITKDVAIRLMSALVTCADTADRIFENQDNDIVAVSAFFRRQAADIQVKIDGDE